MEAFMYVCMCNKILVHIYLRIKLSQIKEFVDQRVRETLAVLEEWLDFKFEVH